jgi:hypothetical protein
MNPRPPGTKDPHYHELRNLWGFVRKDDLDNTAEFLRRFPAFVNAPIRTDDNDEGKKGDTALHIAAHMSHLGIIDYLVSKGASIEDVNADLGETPLSSAAMSNQEKAVGHLLKKGARTEARDKAGWTALYHASQRGCESVLGALIKAGADIEARANDKKTPLMAAIRNHNDGAAIRLLEAGAKTLVGDDEGNTPFSLLAGRGTENNTGRKMRQLVMQRFAAEQEAMRLAQERERREMVEEITEIARSPIDIRGKTMGQLKFRRA